MGLRFLKFYQTHFFYVSMFMIIYDVQPFRENIATTIGLYFDGVAGTLTYYKDGACLGVAFTGLQDVTEPLYPIVCSTAAKTGQHYQWPSP